MITSKECVICLALKSVRQGLKEGPRMPPDLIQDTFLSYGFLLGFGKGLHFASCPVRPPLCKHHKDAIRGIEV